jgi:hypothetical protein
MVVMGRCGLDLRREIDYLAGEGLNLRLSLEEWTRLGLWLLR